MLKQNEVRELVGRARRGDQGAFSELATHFGDALRMHCTRWGAGRDRSDDLSQKVFVTAWKRLQEMDSDVPFWPWLKSIFQYHLFNEMRQAQRERLRLRRYRVVRGSTQRLTEPLSSELDFQIEYMRECIGELSEEKRQLLRMRYEENCSAEQIGERLGRSCDAVRQKLSRVRAELRDSVNARMQASGVV